MNEQMNVLSILYQVDSGNSVIKIKQEGFFIVNAKVGVTYIWRRSIERMRVVLKRNQPSTADSCVHGILRNVPLPLFFLPICIVFMLYLPSMLFISVCIIHICAH